MMECIDLLLKVTGVVGIIGMLAYMVWSVKFVTKIMDEYNRLIYNGKEEES